MYEYYAIEKQKIFCMLSLLPLCLAIVPVSCRVPQSPTFAVCERSLATDSLVDI